MVLALTEMSYGTDLSNVWFQNMAWSNNACVFGLSFFFFYNLTIALHAPTWKEKKWQVKLQPYLCFENALFSNCVQPIFLLNHIVKGR